MESIEGQDSMEKVQQDIIPEGPQRPPLKPLPERGLPPLPELDDTQVKEREGRRNQELMFESKANAITLTFLSVLVAGGFLIGARVLNKEMTYATQRDERLKAEMLQKVQKEAEKLLPPKEYMEATAVSLQMPYLHAGSTTQDVLAVLWQNAVSKSHFDFKTTAHVVSSGTAFDTNAPSVEVFFEQATRAKGYKNEGGFALRVQLPMTDALRPFLKDGRLVKPKPSFDLFIQPDLALIVEGGRLKKIKHNGVYKEFADLDQSPQLKVNAKQGYVSPSGEEFE